MLRSSVCRLNLGLGRVGGDVQWLGAAAADLRQRVPEHDLTGVQAVLAGRHAQPRAGARQAERGAAAGADHDRRAQLGLAVEARHEVERPTLALVGRVGEARAVARDVDRVQLSADRDDTGEEARRHVAADDQRVLAVVVEAAVQVLVDELEPLVDLAARPEVARDLALGTEAAYTLGRDHQDGGAEQQHPYNCNSPREIKCQAFTDTMAQ